MDEHLLALIIVSTVSAVSHTISIMMAIYAWLYNSRKENKQKNAPQERKKHSKMETVSVYILEKERTNPKKF